MWRWITISIISSPSLASCHKTNQSDLFQRRSETRATEERLRKQLKREEDEECSASVSPTTDSLDLSHFSQFGQCLPRLWHISLSDLWHIGWSVTVSPIWLLTLVHLASLCCSCRLDFRQYSEQYSKCLGSWRHIAALHYPQCLSKSRKTSTSYLLLPSGL